MTKDMNQRKEKEPCGSTAQNNCRPIEDAVMDLMVSYGIALINLSDVLTKIIKNVTEDSNYYLNNQIWSSKGISMLKEFTESNLFHQVLLTVPEWLFVIKMGRLSHIKKL